MGPTTARPLFGWTTAKSNAPRRGRMIRASALTNSPGSCGTSGLRLPAPPPWWPLAPSGWYSANPGGVMSLNSGSWPPPVPGGAGGIGTGATGVVGVVATVADPAGQLGRAAGAVGAVGGSAAVGVVCASIAPAVQAHTTPAATLPHRQLPPGMGEPPRAS